MPKTKKTRSSPRKKKEEAEQQQEVPEALREAIQGKMQQRSECKHTPAMANNVTMQDDLSDYCTKCDERMWWIRAGQCVTHIDKIQMDEKSDAAERLQGVLNALHKSIGYLDSKMLESIKKRSSSKTKKKKKSGDDDDDGGLPEGPFAEALLEELRNYGFVHSNEIDVPVLESLAKKYGFKLSDDDDDDDDDDVDDNDDKATAAATTD